MTRWTPSNELELRVAAALAGEGAHADTLDEGIEALLRTFHGYKGAYDEEVSKRSGIFGRISTLEAERDGYKGAYEEEVTKRADILGRISTLEAERDGYKGAYDEEMAKRADILGRISTLAAERDGYKNAHDEEMAKRADILGRISTLEAERDGYKGAHDEEMANRAEILGRISTLEAERDGYKNAHDEEMANRAEILGRISTLAAERDGYKNAHDEEMAKRAEILGRISTLEAERDGYKNAHDEEMAKRAEILGRISTLEAERDGYKNAHDEEMANRAEILGRISTLGAQRDGYKNAHDEEMAKRAEILGRISTLEAERDGYKNAHDEEMAKRADILGRISTLEAERDGYKNAHEDEVAKRSGLLERISTLEAERDGFENAYRTTSAHLDRERRRSHSVELTVANLGPRRPVRSIAAASRPVAQIQEAPMSEDHAFDRLVLAGREEERQGRRDQAIDCYIGAMRLAHRHGPALVEATRIAKDLFQEALRQRDGGEADAALARMVRSLELNPNSQEVRDALQALLDQRPGRDLTQECLIFPDPDRATRFYRDAIQTCMDFVVHGGIQGEIMEFGVLGGWTARHFAEIARDMAYYGDLMLFDSFAGLPRMKGEIDRSSYDVTRGIWREEMELPKSWEEEIGASIDQHVHQMLSQVISPSRIKIRKGFYAQALQAPLGAKAALVHMDCDLYQSTSEVLMALERDAALQDGTIIMFDDWNCNRANPAFGQRRAFREFLERNQGRWGTSHYLSYGFNCAAFILHAVDREPSTRA